MKRYNYRLIDFEDLEYPKSLRVIDNPPKELYCAGDISLLKSKNAAVVGSRKFTSYGREVSGLVSRELAKVGITVVSGMAYGIDTFAHEGALKVSGKTAAVLGTGLNKAYPAVNRGLMDRIYEEGLLISEFEPDFPGKKYAFPLRNRIISGLSSHVIIVEAGLKSGALITASYALEQGKEIYSVPGNIMNYSSAGTNKLISDGAIPLININDLISDMGVNSIDNGDELKDLSEDEKKFAMMIKNNSGITTEGIYDRTNKKISSINAMVTVLELKGVIRTFGGRIYYDV